MRRRSFSRPKEKLRGVNRRLRALEKWSNNFENHFPIEHSDEKYWNYKIPVLDRMVNSPTTSEYIQSHCINAIFHAANQIHNAKPKSMDNAIVTALITYPDMFDSEVCVFFDSKYFNGFFKRNDENNKMEPITNRSLLNLLNIKRPPSCEEVGYNCVITEHYDGKNHFYEQEWWMYIFD